MTERSRLVNRSMPFFRREWYEFSPDHDWGASVVTGYRSRNGVLSIKLSKRC